MAAIALGFASALVWGAADFLGGLKTKQVALFGVILLSQAAGLAPLLVAAAVRGDGPPPLGEILPWCVLGATAGTLGLAALYRGLATGPMGVVAPISASAATIPFFVGVLSGERPGALQVLGIVVAIAGVAVVSWEPPEEHGAGRGRASTGAVLGLIAALGFGLFFVGLDEASESDTLWALVLTRSVSTGALALAALALRPSMGMSGADARAVGAVGVLDVAANTLFALASQEGLVSVVAVLGSLYPVATVLLARVLLGERLRAAQRGGALTAFVGVALISAG